MQTKRLTRKLKIQLSNLRLNPENWLLGGEDKDTYTLVHRHTGNKRIIPK